MTAGPTSALLVVGSILSLQAGAVLAVAVLPHLGASVLTFLRLAFGALLLGVVLRPRAADVRRTGLVLVVALGIVVALDNWLFYVAVQRLDLGPVVTLAFLGPLLLAAAAARSGRSVACVVSAGVGVALLTRNLGPRPLLGAVFAAASGAAIAAYVVLTRAVAVRCADCGPLPIALAAGALVTVPLVLADGAGGLEARGLVLGFAVAVIASALPYALELRASRGLPVSAFALLLCLEPGVAAVIGWAVLDQDLGGRRLVGVALVTVAGVVAAAAPARSPAPGVRLPNGNRVSR